MSYMDDATIAKIKEIMIEQTGRHAWGFVMLIQSAGKDKYEVWLHDKIGCTEVYHGVVNTEQRTLHTIMDCIDLAVDDPYHREESCD